MYTLKVEIFTLHSHLDRGEVGGMLATRQHTNTHELYLIANYSHQAFEYWKSLWQHRSV